MSVERKLATVLFVDIVGSSELVAGTDPEVVRRRVTQFFDHASSSIELYGGTVEKFAGDAVMAAFGVPQAHEDDAERALRAALAIVASVGELGLQARIGVESGEVVTDDRDSTFATGEAVTCAARLQQEAEPNEILVGEGAHRLADRAIEFEPAGRRELRGLGTFTVWRAVGARESPRPLTSLAAPLVGRDSELDLLENTFERAVRNRRAHLFTIYGEPGVGKSRLAREFLAGLDGTTLLVGRSLPYGEGITYWPLAEMVKSAAGISDDDPVAEAHEKLVECCEDEAVADLLALAVGVLEAVEGERSGQEIAWAAREWAEQLASAQPLVLAFEDIHWAEEPLLELIGHLAAWVRDAPILILCLARPELLDVHPNWGGGRLRSTTIELEALPREDSEELVDTLLAESSLPLDVRAELLAKTEGNPLFVEETIRMLTEGDADGHASIPETVQALIAARIDRLPAADKQLLQRAAVIGRIFWAGAVTHLLPESDEVDQVLDDLLLRDFVVREPRSTISGERAFRFKHVLIREVAYRGLTKWARAEHHRRFADWLRERSADELLEIRAYHLGRSAELRAELDGVPPTDLAVEAAAALQSAGKLALAREANRSARKLFLQAVDLAPTLERRFLAARAAWRLDNLSAVWAEMQLVRADAREAGTPGIEGQALVALAEVKLVRDADLPGARRMVEEGHDLLEGGDNFPGRVEALQLLGTLAWWEGDAAASERYAQKAYDVAHATSRNDLKSAAAQRLAQAAMIRRDLTRAEELAADALALAEESGSIVGRAKSLHVQGGIHQVRGELEEAITLYDQAIALYAEAGTVRDRAQSLNHLADALMQQGDIARAEKVLREAIKELGPLQERGYLCESERLLAEVLVRQGKLEEAERLALRALETVGPHDVTSRATTRMALGLVRVAQGREDEGERLLREAADLLGDKAVARLTPEVLNNLATFLRERGRVDEAEPYERRAAELVSTDRTVPIA
jgi:class 3 adenylate cyclase/tetratricopeptide (TPR) repeat protein